MTINVRMVATYAILGLAVIALMVLLFVGRGSEEQVWAALMLILGALVRDLASIQSASAVEKITEGAIIQETIRQDRITGPPAA